MVAIVSTASNMYVSRREFHYHQGVRDHFEGHCKITALSDFQFDLIAQCFNWWIDDYYNG